MLWTSESVTVLSITNNVDDIKVPLCQQKLSWKWMDFGFTSSTCSPVSAAHSWCLEIRTGGAMKSSFRGFFVILDIFTIFLVLHCWLKYCIMSDFHPATNRNRCSRNSCSSKSKYKWIFWTEPASSGLEYAIDMNIKIYVNWKKVKLICVVMFHSARGSWHRGLWSH